jgi:formylglycine-generating enzyme required for sulfatase activity
MSEQLKQEIKDIKRKLTSLEAQLQKPLPEMVQLPDRAYSVGKYPVLVSEYNFFCRETGLSPKPDPDLVKQYPVTNVSWYDASEYCKWLSTKTNDTYRLPTEDEFEHFCGDHIEGFEEIAVFDTQSLAPVGTKKPNKYGLYDCLGNIWEWTGSWLDNRMECRVVRGGSWFYSQAFARLGFRDDYDPDLRFSDLGFRVVCTITK